MTDNKPPTEAARRAAAAMLSGADRLLAVVLGPGMLLLATMDAQLARHIVEKVLPARGAPRQDGSL